VLSGCRRVHVGSYGGAASYVASARASRAYVVLQDSAGMVTTDWVKFAERKDNGLVSDVFSSESRMRKLPGGHRLVSDTAGPARSTACQILRP
jgi:glutamine phosphoribosylpyrophosphate amidotransferase